MREFYLYLAKILTLLSKLSFFVNAWTDFHEFDSEIHEDVPFSYNEAVHSLEVEFTPYMFGPS